MARTGAGIPLGRTGWDIFCGSVGGMISSEWMEEIGKTSLCIGADKMEEGLI